MLIISHRGFWLAPAEKNTVPAFERSFQHGFGLETDIRDYQGALVIAHDIPDASTLPCRDFFKLHQSINTDLPLALNIKADGLQGLLKNLLDDYQINRYFVFDMSVPDLLGYLRAGLNSFSRQSEYEPEPACYDQVTGVWLDAFHGDWWDTTTVTGHLARGKQVCIVSPELHKRPHLPLWEKMAGWPWQDDPNVLLCTDFPQQAKDFFHG